MNIVTATQMAELDRKTIAERNVPGSVLMERAGRGIYDAIIQFLDDHDLPEKVLLLAGKGNNGGDAFVVARLLTEQGISNTTLVLTDPATIQGDARTAFDAFKTAGCTLHVVQDSTALQQTLPLLKKHSLIIDGILGTGFRGEITGFFAEIIHAVNAQSAPVIAIDIPSGISGTDGYLQGPCIHAQQTITMALPKRGCFLGQTLNHVGELKIVDIGIPQDLVQATPVQEQLLTHAEMAQLLPRRKRISHKGTYGKLLVLAGSPGFTGAASLACQSALRAGVGLTYLGIPKSLNPIMEAKLTETITLPLPETDQGTLSTMALDQILHIAATVDAVILGPGIGTAADTIVLVKTLLQKLNVPLVLDADALNCISTQPDLLKNYTAPLVVSPHIGEMSRLTGKSSAEIAANRFETARNFADTYNVITILKGMPTVIADPQRAQLTLNITGNPGMASAGMGDVLAGMLGAFLAQQFQPITAAHMAVFLHGSAGNIAAEQIGEYSLIASDVIDALPLAFMELQHA